MRIEIAGLHEELGTTMIYVTHDQVEAMTMADKIVVLNGGRVEQVGAPLELYHRPANLFVAGFIGSPKMNLIKTRVIKGGGGRATVELPGGSTVGVPSAEMRFQKSAPIVLGVRPEHLTVLASSTNGGTPPEGLARGAGYDGVIEGTVRIAERLGAESILYVEVPGADHLLVRTAGLAGAKSGEKVRIGVPALACHIFDTEGGAMLNSRLDAPPAAARSARRLDHRAAGIAGGRPRRCDCASVGACVGPAFDLDLRAKSEAVGAERRAGRQPVGPEIAEIHLVELGPFRHIGEHHRALEDIVEGQAVLLQHGADVLHRLARLRLHAARHELQRAGNVAERAGEIKYVADAHRLAEGKLCGPGRRRVDELHDPSSTSQNAYPAQRRAGQADQRSFWFRTTLGTAGKLSRTHWAIRSPISSAAGSSASGTGRTRACEGSSA